VKKIWYTLPLTVLAFTLIFTVIGCNKEDEIITPEEQSVDKEAIVENNFSSLGKIITDAASDAIYRSNGTPPPGTGCPSIIDSANRFLALYFGEVPGCVSVIDGVRRSGSYEVSYNIFPSSDSTYCSIKFIDFRIWKTTSNADTNFVKIQTGTIYFSIKKTGSSSYNLRARGEVLLINQTGDFKEVYLDSLNGTVNSAAPNNTDDDSYLLYGGLRMKDNKLNITYSLHTPSLTPLNFVSTCKFPLSGIMDITNVGGKCDFSPNGSACDGIVKISKGSTTKEIDLSGVNF